MLARAVPLPLDMTPPAALERVALDASALLGANRTSLSAAAALDFYAGYWSPWIVGEFVRKRTEWIAERAAREGCNRAETRRRLRASRQRVNILIADLSHVLQSVDYPTAPSADLAWLADPDDWPIMQTALAAPATVLVTDNSSDFPLGEIRNGVLLLGSTPFLNRLYRQFPDAEAAIQEFLAGATKRP
ncbi:MAG TPA: hypothetical protein VNL16_18795 [Chloroflexota bacterium]|nr:hypothetical protein [Chloroflexota bacterium]